MLDTPISPELLPPDAQGKIAQQTEDLVGPYALHDFFLYHALNFGFTPEKIYTLACRAFKDDFEPAAIKKWLRTCRTACLRRDARL
jgi:NAD+ synthase (glutamine-hydrolysing)